MSNDTTVTQSKGTWSENTQVRLYLCGTCL